MGDPFDRYCNLKQLNAFAIQQSALIADVFPQRTKLERRYFQLLKKAYVEARYSEHYEITQEELQWLAGRVEQLQALVATLCQDKIKSYE